MFVHPKTCIFRGDHARGARAAVSPVLSQLRLGDQAAIKRRSSGMIVALVVPRSSGSSGGSSGGSAVAAAAAAADAAAGACSASGSQLGVV